MKHKMDKKKIPLPAEDLVLKKMRRIDALTASELAQAKKSQMKEEYTLSPAEGIVAKKIQVAQLLLGTPRDNLPRRGGLIHSLWRAGGVPALEYVAHRQRTSVVTIIMEGLKTPGPGSATFKRLVEFRNVMPIASQRILIVYHAKLFSGELELPPKRPEDIPVTGEKPAWKEDFSGSPPPRSIPRGVESKARMQNRALAKTSRQPTPAELETLSTALAREHAAKVADLESAAAAGDGQAHKELARMKKERTQPKTHQDYEVSTHSHSWPTDVVLKAAGQGTEEERDLNVRVLESREDLWPVLLPLVAPKGKINSRVVAKFREVQADKFAGRIEQLHEDPMTMEEFGHRAENPMKHPYFQG